MPDVRDMSYIQAVNHGLRWALDTVPEAIVFGEDVAVPGGPFGATKNLHRDFGASRIFDTPISETAFLGAALGAAMTGSRPIVEIMYADFMFVAMDQIVNQIANIRYSSNGNWTAPLVIRTQQGYSPGSCAQHSRSIEAYLAHTPGLRVVAPATPMDAYQTIRSAVTSDDPVVVIESRMLYPTKGPVELDSVLEPIGGSRRRRLGDDVTIVAWSRAVQTALVACDELASEGISADVIDLRWLSPLDLDPVVESVSRTGRLMIVHEAVGVGGFGAEVAAQIQAACFGSLAAPIERVVGSDVPIPAAPALQAAAVPTAPGVSAAARRLVSFAA